MKLLQVDSSITGEQSVTRLLTHSIVQALIRANSAVTVIHRDLVETPLQHLELSALGGASEAAAGSVAALDEFLDADIVVVGAPMYNFTLSSQLKAWVDRLVIQGKTFRYSEGGVEGLAGPKRVIVAVARGGFYGSGSPFAANEHVETYLRSIFRFIGVEPEFIVAEGIAVSPEYRATAISSAEKAIAVLAG